MDKKIRDELILIIKNSLPNLSLITGGMGISFGDNKKYYPKAKEAAQKKTVIKDKKIYWIPILEKEKAQLVCGIEAESFPVLEIDLINGLHKEFKYRLFLGKQVEKFQDPKSSFIKKVLFSEKITTMEQAIDNGDIVGVNLRSSQAVILIKIPGFLKSVQEKCEVVSEEKCAENVRRECNKIIKSISKGFKNYDQNIITYLDNDMFVVLKWAKGKISTLNTIDFFKRKAEYINSLVKKETGFIPSIGVGQYYPGLTGLRKSYNDAKIALEIGERIFSKKRVYHITDIGLFISLSEDVSFDRKCEIAHQILGEIISDKDLFKTIKTFLECNMNLTDAAKKLHLHRNTLIYRLDRIKEDIGLDPRKFKDAVQIKMGLMLYSPLVTNCIRKK